jgi:hypothetical protein
VIDLRVCNLAFKTVSNYDVSPRRPMTAAELRDRILDLIREWIQNKDVQASETAVLVLNDLAGDIQVIDLGEKLNAG